MEIKNNKSKALTSQEIDLLSYLELKSEEVYTRDEINEFFNDNKKTAGYIIKKLLEKKRLLSLIKNTYLVVPLKAPPGLWSANEYSIAKKLIKNSTYYIGYAGVFNSYGFTEQVAQMVHILNDTYSGEKIILGIKYKMIKVLKNRFYGLEERIIDNKIVVFPKKERAMIDVFEFYKNNPRKAFKILNEHIAKLNIKVFVNFVSKYPVQIIRRRIGYFLNQLNIVDTLLDKIDSGRKGYSPLYEKISLKGRINKRWRVIINE